MRCTVVGLCIAVTAVAWHKLLQDEFFPKRWRAIIPGQVYGSGQISGRLIGPTLSKYDIEVVVDLNGLDRNDPMQMAELTACEELGVEHHRFALGGNGTGSIDHYAQAIEQIESAVQKDRRVLVHCYAGLQRTNGVVAAWRLLVRGDTPQDVYQSILHSGWDGEDNPDLLPFLNANIAAIGNQLIRRGVITELPADLPQLPSEAHTETHRSGRFH